MICKVSGRELKGGIGKEVCDERSRRTMRELLSNKGSMKRTAFDLVDWGDIDKIMDNSPQQFCLWVTKHVSKFCGTKKCYTDGKMQQICYAPAA